jgi:hypothetical protein
MKGRNGQVSIEDLPPELQEQIRAALGSVPKKQKLGEPLTKGQVLLASSRVMEATWPVPAVVSESLTVIRCQKSTEEGLTRCHSNE